MRVVFMGTPDFAVPALEAVHGNHEVVAVYSQPDKPAGRGQDMRPTPVKAKALALGLSVHQPEKLGTPDEFARLQALSPDVIVVVAYGKLLRKNVLDLPRHGCVNIHSSLLPRWRGAAPIQWAILGGDLESGVTTMLLDEGMDTGAILMQARTPLGADETAGTLHDRLALMGAELIVPTLAGLASGELKPTPQDNALATHASKLTKEMERLDPAESAVALERRVRALNPWPGTSLWVFSPNEGPEGSPIGVRLKVKRVRAHRTIAGKPGRIFEHAGMLLFGTSDGSLELQSVQWEGKREVDAAGFMNGLRGRGQALPLETVAPPVASASGS